MGDSWSSDRSLWSSGARINIFVFQMGRSDNAHASARRGHRPSEGASSSRTVESPYPYSGGPQISEVLKDYHGHVARVIWEKNEVVWNPYIGKLIGDFSYFCGIIFSQDLNALYLPDRIVRQFGYVQNIPIEAVPCSDSQRSSNSANFVATMIRARDRLKNISCLRALDVVPPQPSSVQHNAPLQYLRSKSRRVE